MLNDSRISRARAASCFICSTNAIQVREPQLVAQARDEVDVQRLDDTGRRRSRTRALRAATPCRSPPAACRDWQLPARSANHRRTRGSRTRPPAASRAAAAAGSRSESPSLRPSFAPSIDLAGHPIRPPEQLRRTRHVARVQRRADQRTADALAVDLERRHFGDRETRRGPERAQHRNVARHVAPELKSCPTTTWRAPSASTSTCRRTRRRSSSAAPRRSAGRRSDRRRSCCSASNFSRKRVRRAGGVPLAKNSRGVGSNDSRAAGSRCSRRDRPQHPDHLLVAAVDAVESADREHATASCPIHVVQAPNELHRGLALPIVHRKACIIGVNCRKSGRLPVRLATPVRLTPDTGLQPELPGPHAEQPQTPK